MDPRLSSSMVGPTNSNNTRRRAPIPRPWLMDHHHLPPPVHPLHHHHHHHHNPNYRYGPPPLMGAPAYPIMTMTNGAFEPDSMDLLPQQDWTVSWNKLSCCFCLKEKTSSQKNNPSSSTSSPWHHNDHVAFPAFLRRNSSSSLLDQNDVYPSSGSVSSFTDTSSSSSSSSDGPRRRVVRNDTFDSEELRRPITPPPRASTPPPNPVTHKPATISNRCQSAGLPPPMNNTFNNTNGWGNTLAPQPQQPPARQRIDSGMYSGTTNSSRHRRQRQFQFSNKSMEQIWQGKAGEEQLSLPPLPSVVSLQHTHMATPHDSGYISALDDSEDWGAHDHSMGSYYDGDYDDDDDDPNGEDNSPFAQLQQRKVARNGNTTTERRRRKGGDRPPKASSSGGAARQSKKASRDDKTSSGNQNGQRPPPKKPEPTTGMVPVYLPKELRLDNATEGNLVVSGWVAVSIGSSLEERFHHGSKRIDAKDIMYLRIVDVFDGAIIFLHKSCEGNQIQHELHLRRDWMCSSREISSRIGRCVHIASRSNPAFCIADLLPVSLDESFFPEKNQLVSAQQFAKQHDRLFVAGKGKVYAPDEQHDAAMYIMFSLDALIKNCL